MISPISALGAALIVGAGTATAAPAANAAPAPIVISDCRTVADSYGRHRSVQQTIDVTFTNVSHRVADTATFTVSDGHGKFSNFVARGSFSGGVLIADRIVPMSEAAKTGIFSDARAAGCTLTSVHFIDGTTWTNPADHP